MLKKSRFFLLGIVVAFIAFSIYGIIESSTIIQKLVFAAFTIVSFLVLCAVIYYLKINVYDICRFLNVMLPIITLCIISLMEYKKSFVTIFLTYIAYFCVKGWAKRSGNSRWFFEPFIFIGVIIFEYMLFTEECIMRDRIILTIIMFGLLVSRVIIIKNQTDEYRAGAIERVKTAENYRKEKYEMKLENAIEQALYNIEHARTYDERKKAEVDLERAKLKKEEYYNMKS